MNRVFNHYFSFLVTVSGWMLTQTVISVSFLSYQIYKEKERTTYAFNAHIALSLYLWTVILISK